jgi:8-oxo-dGTP pyrophosphatase MutT (NUDIX family)
VSEGAAAPAVARPAATVLLLRDDPLGVQVYFLRRPARSSFAASAYVFPGGTLDADDGGDEALALAPGFDARRAAPRMHLDSDDDALRCCAGLHVAAVREVFEETGILIGARAGGGVLGEADAADLGAARRELLDGAPFAPVLRRHTLQIAPERLTYVAHFITPEGEPRRYDTRFFACPAPVEQEGAHHAGEATESGWYTAAAALQMTEGSFAMMLPPTRIMCNEVARHATAAEAIADLGTRPVDAILFRIGDVVAGHLPTSLPEHWPPQAPAST